MILRNKILSHFLLAIYLLVVLHQSVSHSHVSEFSDTPEPTHQHNESQTVHHEHHFHVGIFHFIGHLFEKINHSSDQSDEHIILVQKTATKKIVDYKKSKPLFFEANDELVFKVDAESLPDPPYHLSLLQKLKLPSTPLRAPPALV